MPGRRRAPLRRPGLVPPPQTLAPVVFGHVTPGAAAAEKMPGAPSLSKKLVQRSDRVKSVDMVRRASGPTPRPAAAVRRRRPHPLPPLTVAPPPPPARPPRRPPVPQHPTEPWVLCGLYSGKAVIYSYATQALVKSFDVSEQPVR